MSKYIIGVDGGGTKTIAVLADMNGKILKTRRSGASNPHNVGAESAIDNVFAAIFPWLKIKDIRAIFIGLAGVQEDEITRRYFEKKLSGKIKNFRGILDVGSDQRAAFRAGTEEKNGVLLISGTGCVARGWHKGKERKASGFGWLADEGSAFWAGQKVFQVLLKYFDGRGYKTSLAKEIFREFELKNIQDLMRLIYQNNPTLIIPKFSVICDRASRKGDKVAKEIMLEAGKELALSANTVIRKLNFQKERFPIVLVGGMFKSDILLDVVKKEVRKFAPKADFIRPKADPVIGAVKLAIERANLN